MKLRSILTYIGVCDGKMEEGSLMRDASRMSPFDRLDQRNSAPKREIKNLNSFRSVFKGIEFETHRQAQMLNRARRINSTGDARLERYPKQITFSQRSKEGEAEYRYFPEPDLSRSRFQTNG